MVICRRLQSLRQKVRGQVRQFVINQIGCLE